MICDFIEQDIPRKRVFHLLKDSETLYTYETAWLDAKINIGIPIHTQDAGTIKCSKNNEDIMKGTFELLSNELLEISKTKSIVGIKSISKNSVVKNNKNVSIGKIYRCIYSRNNSADVLELNNDYLEIRKVELGTTCNYPIYKRNMQIGEVVMSNETINDRRKYKIFIKDDYQEIISWIGLYIIWLNHNRPAKFSKERKVIYRQSYSKTNVFYDVHWIEKNFDLNAISEDKDFFRMFVNRKEAKSNTIKFMGIVLALIFVVGISYCAFK